MLALNDDQLAVVMTAASGLPVEKRTIPAIGYNRDLQPNSPDRLCVAGDVRNHSGRICGSASSARQVYCAGT